MNTSKLAWTVGSLLGAQKALNLARSFEIDDVLGVVGLERRRSAFDRMLPAIGIFGVGAAAGAACALLLAPKSGAETRALLGDKLHQAKEQFDEGMHKAQSRLNEASQRVQAQLEHRNNNGGA
jgi:hypothetical protein